MFDQDFIVADFSFDKRIYWKHYQHFMWKKKDGFISGCVCVVWMAFGHDRRSLGQDLFNTSDQWLLAFVGVNGKIEGISSDDESKMKKQRFSGVRGLCVVNKRTFFFWWFMQTIKKPDGLITQNHSAWGHSHRQAKRKTDWLTKANSLANVWHTSCKKFEGIMQQPYPFSIQGNTSICTVLVKGYRCIRSDALLRLKWTSTQISV